MIAIYADANSRDEQGRYLLNIAGSRQDLERAKDELVDGLRVKLNVQNEFEVRATLIFEEIWRAIPDMESDEPVVRET
jgi:hypothetical protein